MKKQILVIACIVAVTIGITFTIVPINLQNDLFQFETMGSEGIPRAAVIDQLYNDFPNEEFQNKATKHLNDLGYKVDYYLTDEITVDFFKELPSMNYGFIIFR